MKRIIIAILVLACTSAAPAQQGLHVQDVFDGHIIPQERMVETRVRGKTLAKYQLTFYHSVRFKASEEEAARVLALMERDKQPKQSYSESQVPLPPRRSHTVKMQLTPKGSAHRFLCYQARWEKKDCEVTLVYMEGSLSSLSQLNELLNK